MLESGQGGGVLGKLAGKGIEGAFRSVAAIVTKLFVLKLEGTLRAVLFAGAQEEGGVAGEIGGLDLTAGDLAKGFLSKGGENGLGNLTGTAADERDQSIGFLGSAIDAAGPAFMRVGSEELIDLATSGGRQAGILKAEIDGIVIGAFAQPDEDVFLLFLREEEEGIGGRFCRKIRERWAVLGERSIPAQFQFSGKRSRSLDCGSIGFVGERCRLAHLRSG